MKIIVIGGGGREHAIIKKLKESPSVDIIYALPGNGGISADALCVDISATDIEAVVNFSIEQKADFVVVTPDDPLVLGMVDALEAAGIPCFGPNKNAAIIEGSKIFAKDLMKKYDIPSAEYQSFDSMERALKYLDTAPLPTVIKADGLALGKGVVIAKSLEEARAAVHSIMGDKLFGESGNRIVIEEYLEGPEVSVLSLTDGKVIIPMISSMDHKRAKDDDTGLNTGGMGAVAPNPYYTKEIAELCMETIFFPTVNAMNAENRSFKGCLYFGIMLTSSGPKVIEFNCRFGDPEAQVVLPLLESDLLEIMMASRNGNLSKTEVKFSDSAACCVIMASKGYPEEYKTGFEISLPDPVLLEGVNIYFAGTRLENIKLLTNGGRVLGVSAVGDNLRGAVDRAYSAVKEVSFGNAYYRSDIGRKALRHN